MRVIGILGGTFDPVHCGHLRLAIESRELLQLDEVVLMPAGSPRLRGAPLADAGTRLRLLAAAVDDLPGLRIDARELAGTAPTSTVATLRELRAEYADASLCLILGADAFVRLDDWLDWQALPALAHLVVARRPGSELPVEGPVAALIAERASTNHEVLRNTRCGCVLLADIPALDVSASRVRTLLAAGRNPRFLVPDRVLDLIQTTGIYADA